MFVVLDLQLVRSSQRQFRRVDLRTRTIVPLVDNQAAVDIYPNSVVRLGEETLYAWFKIWFAYKYSK